MRVYWGVKYNLARDVLESLESLGIVSVGELKDSDVAVIDSDSVGFLVDAIERVKNYCVFVVVYRDRIPSILWLSNPEYHWHNRFFGLPFSGQGSVVEFLLKEFAK